MATGRPARGIGHYLRDLVYGGIDGIITTVAVVSGAQGASFGPRVALILGLANLVADGFSMGVSNYLGLKAELQQRGVSVRLEKPERHGAATFLAFFIFGGVPLLAYAWVSAAGGPSYPAGLAAAAGALLLLGLLRGALSRRGRLRSVTEMVTVGAVAASVAFAVGRLAERALA